MLTGSPVPPTYPLFGHPNPESALDPLFTSNPAPATLYFQLSRRTLHPRPSPPAPILPIKILSIPVEYPYTPLRFRPTAFYTAPR